MSYDVGFKAFAEEHVAVSFEVPVLFFAVVVWAANLSHQAAKQQEHKGVVFKHETHTKAS